MLELKDREWEEFRVDQIFIQERGKEKAPKQNGDGDIPLIVETESNNGVLKNAAPTKVFNGNAITVSINVPKNVFYQEKDFCASVNIAILRNDYINRYSGLFIANLISYANRKYNYGNKQSKDRLNATIISLPVNTDGQPDYNFMEQYIREREPDYSWATGCIEPNAEISLQDREWAEFRVGDIFNVSLGKYFSKSELESVDTCNVSMYTPYVTRSVTNNGVEFFTSSDVGYTECGGAITVSCMPSACDGTCAFYQDKDFLTGNMMNILRNNKLNKYNGVFICNCINFAALGKFSYAKNLGKQALMNLEVCLPVKTDGQPDYEFMEQYIKSLPFSKVLE